MEFPFPFLSISSHVLFSVDLLLNTPVSNLLIGACDSLPCVALRKVHESFGHFVDCFLRAKIYLSFFSRHFHK